MLVICPIFDRIDLLPFYIKHYERLGATWFIFTISDQLYLETTIKCINEHVTTRWSAPDGPLCSREAYDSTLEADRLNQILGLRSMGDERWYCLADLDEFLYLRGCSLHDMALIGDELACDGFMSTLVDRVAVSGFPSVPAYGSATLDDTFSRQCMISQRAGANHQKVSIARIDQPISAGQHAIPGRVHDVGNENHHFKWTAGIQARLADKHKRMTALGKPWANELAHELELIESGKYATDECGFKAARRIGI